MITPDKPMLPATLLDGDDDWAKGERLLELRVRQQFSPAPVRPQYHRDNYPGEELEEIERENFNATRT